MRRGSAIVLLLFTAVVAFMLIDGWRAFGTAAEGERLERMQRSSNWGEGVFVNTIPLYNPFFEAGAQVNGLNEAQRRFGRRWQLGLRWTF